MIKSEIQNTSKPKHCNYPILKYVENDNGIKVVLFTSKGRGMIIKTRSNDNPVGYTSSEWTEIGFDIYDGSVKLENE